MPNLISTRKIIFLFLSHLVAFAGISQQRAKQMPVQLSTSPKGYTIGFLEYLPRDYGNQLHPLIIYLHGIGERGASGTVLGTDAQTAQAVAANEIPKLCAAGATMTFTANCQTSSFVVLSPQLYSNFGTWQNWYVDEILAYAKTLKIDTNRIYLTGISLGGGGTWKYASASQGNASRFAAIAPVCGTCDWSDLCNIPRANTPVWAFHASDDGTVGVGCTNSAIAAIKACNPAAVANATIYPTGNHWIWPRSYDTAHTWQTPNLFEWFLMQKRTSTVPEPPKPSGLVASAGPDQTVTGTTATLDGSASRGYPGSWAVSWEIVQSVNGIWDVFPGYDKTGTTKPLKNLVPGTWKFRITVQDGKGGSATDEMTLTVR